MSHSLRILHTTEFYPPSLGGSQEVVRQLSERLAARGHEVVVATTRHPGRNGRSRNGVEVREFDITGNAVKSIRGDIDSYIDFVKYSDFDLMMNYGAQVWTTDALLPGLRELPMRKVLVPLGFSKLHVPGYADYYIKMGDWLRRYDASVFLSYTYRDIEFAHHAGALNTVVIPNGASEEEFSIEPGYSLRERLGIPKDQFLILLVGTHSGLKGHQEAMAIFQGARIKRATMLIVGNDEGRGCGTKCRMLERLFRVDPRPHLMDKHLIMTELTREETVAAYKEADLFLFPSNIECSPLVLFEATAAGLPFMTTDVGNASEIIDWTGGGAMMPTVKDQQGYSTADITGSSRLLEDLYHDIDRRRRMGRSGQAAWRESFTWDKIAQRYEELYMAVVNGELEKWRSSELRTIAR